MKKTFVGLTAAALLATSFAVTPAVARDDHHDGKRHHSRHHDRHHDRDRSGLTLQFGSPGAYRCYTYYRYGRRHQRCEPTGGPTLNFRF